MKRLFFYCFQDCIELLIQFLERSLMIKAVIFIEAIPAVYRFVSCRFEWNLTDRAAFVTGYFMHFQVGLVSPAISARISASETA